MIRTFHNNTIAFFAVVFIATLFFSSCGQQIPPTGGPRDTLPPKLVFAVPSQGALNFKGDKIIITFDEYINLDNPFEKVVYSPTPKKNPQVEGKLKNVTIKIKDTLEENTTYSIDFTTSLRDINENNPLRDFTYTFSTGSYIDSGFLFGKVFIAETGKVDSTLIAILQQNFDDSAVAKEKPRYYTKLKGDGSFAFKFIKPGKYNLFALKDADGGKTFNQPSEMIAFLDSPVTVGVDTAMRLYAFEEAHTEIIKPKSTTAKPDLKKLDPKKVDDKRLRLSNNLEGGKQDILSPFILISENVIKEFDTSKIKLTDKDFNQIGGYRIQMDTSGKQLVFDIKWPENTEYKLIVQKDFATDSLNNKYIKTDTLSFITKRTTEYGSLDIKIEHIDTTYHPIIFLKKENKIFLQQKIEEKRYRIKLFKPGDYQLEILYDLNNNGKWDTGNYWEKRQPEHNIPSKQVLQIKANWDNEVNVDLGIIK